MHLAINGVLLLKQIGNVFKSEWEIKIIALAAAVIKNPLIVSPVCHVVRQFLSSNCRKIVLISTAD